MSFRIMFYLILAAAITLTAVDPAGASDEASDINADTEDLTNESDAAAAEVKEVKAALNEDRAIAQRKHGVAKKNYDSAVAKRQAAVDRFNLGEAEIQRLNKETARLNGEVERLNKETSLHEKAMADNKLKAEKIEAEIKTLQELRGETGKKFIEVGIQRDKTDVETKSLEAQTAEAKKALQDAKEQEKLAAAQLAKQKTEYAQNKARTDAYLAGMRERYKEAMDRIRQTKGESAVIEQNEEKLTVQAKAAEAEVKNAEEQAMNRQLSSIDQQPDESPAPAAAAVAAPVAASAATASAPASGSMSFKRTCKVFDEPARGAKVLAVQPSGASVSKVDEGSKWIAFKLNDGRKGFVAKACFR